MEKKLALKIFILSVIVVGIIFLWQRNKDFNLADEGYLWYGVQRVMKGEIPIRDFASYDPGRYYWSAAIMMLMGDYGIMALRVTAAIVQVIGLFVALMLIAKNVKRESFIYLLAAITFVAWMWPYYKIYDITISILLIGVLSFWIRNPSKKNYFLSGCYIGLLTCFGRNHGVYAIAASLGTMTWLQIKSSLKFSFLRGLLFWSGGVTIGFMPILWMALFMPGYGVAFWKSIQFLFEIKTTNNTLPIPWPWLVPFSTLSWSQAIREVSVGMLFIMIVIFGVISLFWVVFKKIRNKYVSPELVACAFFALPYAHYAYSRADIVHLAFGIFPFLIGSFVILGSQVRIAKWLTATIFVFVSLWIVYIYFPGWLYRNSQNPPAIEISGSKIFVDQGTARDVELLRALAKKYMLKDQNFLAVPFWPGAYALLERKSPIRETYLLFPVSSELEKREIEQIKDAKPQFVFILDVPLDGREDLRFKNTHPLIYKYILDNFELVPEGLTPSQLIYKAKKKISTK